MSKLSIIQKQQSFLSLFLQTGALAALGIGQPLLQLVQDNPEFLVVHQSRSWDVLILVTGLLVFLPLVLSAVVFLVSLINSKAGVLLQSVFLGGLFGLVVLPVAGRAIPGIGWLILVLATLAAVVMAFSYFRFKFLKQNLSYLALAIPVFLILFLSAGPIRSILFPETVSATGSDLRVTNPVVMIVFDEFPTSSLLNLDQELDCDLFPNFCRLAESSTWYPNATSVSGATLRAVPTIMTGKFPRWKALPVLAEHPRNIFTLLGSSHEVTALEAQTSLCPDWLKSEAIPCLSERLDLLSEDLVILYQHMVVPEQWRGRLTPVADKWGEFKGIKNENGGGRKKANKMEEFEQFVASLEKGEKPNLAVAHILLPHVPFQFFPDGTIYNHRKRIPVLQDGTWGPDEIEMAHSYRRHILQVVATDRLLGDLLDRLEKIEIFDDALIIITADHGASFRTGLHRRQFNEGNEADIMCVPLFMKFPGQTTGTIDLRYAQSADIMPTLVSALGCQPDWAFDGVDLLEKSNVDRTELDFMDQDTYQELKISPAKMKGMNEVIRWKHDLFGDDGGYERLFTMGDSGGLVGMDVSDLKCDNHSVIRGRVLESLEFENVDLNGSFVPAEVNGFITGHSDKGRLKLALALNGKIVGVTETYLEGSEAGSRNWQVTAQLESFQNGSNKTELFLVTEDASGSSLQRVPLYTPSFLGINMGGQHVNGVQENGLFNPHDWDGRWSRWTNGSGSWKFPLKAGEAPENLILKIVSSGPVGADINVMVNGTRLLSQVLPRGDWETRLPLTNIEARQNMTVEIESSVFVPADNNPKSSDHRELGVAVWTLIVK